MCFILLILGFMLTPDQDVNTDYSRDKISCDYLSNIYVYNNSSLNKYNNQGELMYTFNDSSFGDISLCDCSDPFNIVLYYSDFRYMIILDNNLNVKDQQIDIDNYSDSEVEFICRSLKGNFFFYIPSLNQVMKYSASGKNTDQSSLFSSIANNFTPTQMIINDNNIFLFSKEKILIKLNSNLQFINKYYLTNAEKIFINKGEIFFINKYNIFKYNNINSQSELIYKSPFLKGLPITILNNNIYYYNNELVSSMRF